MIDWFQATKLTHGRTFTDSANKGKNHYDPMSMTSDFSYKLSEYTYNLPLEQIAQHPSTKRDQSRLMVLDIHSDQLRHQHFTDIQDYLFPDDVLVVNNSKVFPARLLGRKSTGGRIELFLLEFPQTVIKNIDTKQWQEGSAIALIKSSKRPKPEDVIHFSDTLQAWVETYLKDGKAKVHLRYNAFVHHSMEDALNAYGQVPLPPYIKREHGSTGEDKIRYQTNYAQHPGSVAAPTAGLHFSDALLEEIKRKGVHIASVTLHVGYGTFAPVRTEDIRQHEIHREQISLSAQTAQRINTTKKRGGRIWAVGTTSVRTLEFATDEKGKVHETHGPCGLYIYPGYTFKTVDNIITNFHLPQSSLLFLVSALAGREKILKAYNEAVRKNYRFFSYGDAMAIITKG